ncbi:SGNH/GDSL hydrolase family protein [Pseudomonas sp. ANT_J12]|uniref:SGNH/GDSL hydrolase family protein n=1 Tax=Pseudomonas sp. ANT_J12 TaxID=2597351 RepID=UPI0015B63AF9|nr:SGNH/GDSL hydrolase family protein [Pseudomonas sp. ANT_J12]
MRACFALTTLLLSSAVFAGIAPDGAPMDEDFHNCDNLDCGVYPMMKFHLTDKTLSGATVNGETFFVAEGDSNFYKTVFPPTRIRLVFNPANGKIYKQGVDYVATTEGIKLTPTTGIEKAPANFVSTITDDERKNYKVRMTPEFQKYQYAVTYDKNRYFRPSIFGKLGNIPAIAGKVPLKVTFFGDSITLGANATDIYAAPNQPGYVGLVMAYLNTQYPGLWEYRNNSVGGWSTKNAMSAVSYRVMDKKSDLVVLGFGMNDSNSISAIDYKHNLQNVISAIRSKQPNVPILLISSISANPDSSVQNRKLLLSYPKMMRGLTVENKNVALADVTETWLMILKNKRYLDLTGNGLNHPNDFGHRVIAEAVLAAVLGDKY